MSGSSDRNETVIIGAGPAGLTAAYELCRSSVPCTVLESDSIVGGISRTVEHNGFRFDIGGHRFYTKVTIINRLWDEILGDDFLHRPRLSRIYYNQKFFDYPLRAANVLSTLGVLESALCVASYCKSRVFPIRPEPSFEDWVINRFGERLYSIFFKSYTEKVWGISCREIQADWAAQRIRGLSLLSAAWNALRPQRGHGGGTIKTLIDSFKYPRLGPGMMWERVAELVRKMHGQIHLQTPAARIHWQPGLITAVEAGGAVRPLRHLVSSMPIRDLIDRMEPAAPAYLAEAAEGFTYRDFITVALFIDRKDVFPDNWIYVQDSSVKVGRIQNFKNWSPDMVPSETVTCLGLEYFCFEGDGLWNSSDSDLVRLATAELKQLGFVDGPEVTGGAVVRMPKAYPVYGPRYRAGLEAVKRFVRGTPNLHLIGRNGMHHYNNQDHSMLTGLLAARNILGENFDLWRVNEDEEYLEAGRVVSDEELDSLRATQPRVPAAREVTSA